MRTILRSNDFSCPTCVTKIEKALGNLPGVETAKVHFSTGRIEVQHDTAETPVSPLIETVRELGYESRPSPF